MRSVTGKLKRGKAGWDKISGAPARSGLLQTEMQAVTTAAMHQTRPGSIPA